MNPLKAAAPFSSPAINDAISENALANTVPACIETAQNTTQANPKKRGPGGVTRCCSD